MQVLLRAEVSNGKGIRPDIEFRVKGAPIEIPFKLVHDQVVMAQVIVIPGGLLQHLPGQALKHQVRVSRLSFQACRSSILNSMRAWGFQLHQRFSTKAPNPRSRVGRLGKLFIHPFPIDHTPSFTRADPTRTPADAHSGIIPGPPGVYICSHVSTKLPIRTRGLQLLKHIK